MNDRKTTGFGVPHDIDPHHFVVEIPAARANPVVVTEHFGLAGGTNGLPDAVVRCRLPQDHWNAVRKELERVLNERLKEKKLTTGRWKSGKNQVERLLGRELCVLLWAVEAAPKEAIPNAIRTWSALKPEERWWLFAMAASVTGTSDDVDVGWRKAIRIAMTENPTGEEVGAIRAKNPRRPEERPTLPLFERVK
ncbi:anti-phage-associated DUF3780 domain-containing protein [Bradyrhizobium sp. RP6]|uniref:anti-phage-associated DUF3780 domain-containing protein n=1 Tax=Bradyrhizobium sp. RP6 TaxID=2489596 RepID=UPI000F53879C|nr:anti-phage-associated DUF3780 domain-containing protein [Bradyrhizobium sp. RP6]RQH12684.1 DUF3780 domain-containing protein [Bradyrhizobium sp. RP6]